jgi:uncharacterized protein YbjT (DUF2867 family)
MTKQPPRGPVTRFEHLLVTGATGNIGAPLVELLLAQGTSCRAAVTDVAGYQHEGHDQETVRFDFNDPSTFAAALDGIDSVFLLRPPAISRVGPTLNRFVTEAEAAGVKHVVFSSVAGAATNKLLPHHRVETHLRATCMKVTVLPPTFFADNLGDAYREDIRCDHRLFVPAATARVAFIDARDIAAVVAQIAQDPSPHIDQGYTLTGSTNYSFAEVATYCPPSCNRNPVPTSHHR